jgi:glycosyltransferase involved in cell wall biosynthesis
VRLAIVYHRPYYRDESGRLWEAEGSFGRYVESLARRVDEVVLCVPRRIAPFGDEAYRLRAENVTICPLPYFESLPAFYAGLPTMLARLWKGLPSWDLVNVRVPTPLGVYAFALAKLRRRPIFLLVVGDLAGVAASVPIDGPKRAAYRAYLAIEERLQAWMVSGASSFVNGQALYAKYHRPGRRVLLTTTSTISQDDVGPTPSALDEVGDREHEVPIRLLCVSRVDPRKGLRFLPEAVARLVEGGRNVTLTIVGPVVGTLGAEERTRVMRAAAAQGVADRIDFAGPKTQPEVMRIARAHDLFVLPTLPGEGVPRVLLEAMAAGLPIVASDVAGVPSLIADGVNGLLVPPGDPAAIADALDRLLRDGALRRQVVENGFTLARAHTTEAHANKIVLGLKKLAGIEISRSRPLRA